MAAKKRGTKKRTKTKRKRARTTKSRSVKAKRIAKRREKRVAPSGRSTVMAATTLAVTAGIITLLAGLLFLIFGAFSTFSFVGVWFFSAFPNIIAGIVMLITAGSMKRKPRASATWLLLFSIIALLTPPFGFIVGPVLGIIGALVVFIKR